MHAVCGSFVPHDDEHDDEHKDEHKDENKNENATKDVTSQLLEQATVVVLYIVPKVLKMLEPRIKRWVKDNPKRRYANHETALTIRIGK